LRGEQVLVLVVSSDRAAARLLETSLPATLFQVWPVEPGAAFEAALSEALPDVVVLDRIHERLEQARDEVRMLDQQDMKMPIIAVSEEPSMDDASLVELGVFFYLSGPIERELVDLVEAAARRVGLDPRKAE